MASSELEKRKLEEYEMQLFGFHSRAVYATLKNIVGERIHCTIEKMCETIEKTYKLNSDNLAVLQNNQKQLIKAYCKGAMPHLENIKNIVNKCIAVPSNVLLEEDIYQRTQYSEIEFENAKQKLDDLQQKAKRATMLNTVLKEELEILEEFPICEESVNKICNMVENGLQCLDINEEVYQLVNSYKQFSTSLLGTVPEKIKYNTVNNLKCKNLDLSTL